ncbi:MAG: hypothetical protein JW927_02420 [Deltaproteobacteria bacterium]|nr:hypothetical protein [Deltaproteobacteria bacterium]
MSKPIDVQSTGCKPSYIIIIFFILQFCFTPLIYSAEKKIDDKEAKNNIFSIYDIELGRISEEGTVYSQHGNVLGSVDKEGIIYNISKIKIGKVEQDGSVLNQANTKLGTVNENGEIYNVSSRKIGQVKDIKDIKLIGGAARLVFF